MLCNSNPLLQHTMTAAQNLPSHRDMARSLLTILASLFLVSLAGIVTAQETEKAPAFSNQPMALLSVEEAFQVAVQNQTHDGFDVRFDIVPGHYLYRERIDVLTDSTTTKIASIYKPDGLEIEDPFFGNTVIYRAPQVVTVGLTRPQLDKAPSMLDMKVLYQGCSDIGICYPPQTHELSVSLPALPEPGEEPMIESLKDRVGLDLPSALNIADPLNNRVRETAASPVPATTDSSLQSTLSDPLSAELLPPDVAFMVSVAQTTDTGLDLIFFAEPGYYLYKDKIKFTLENAGSASITDTVLPKGLEQYDDFFGDVEVYRGSVTTTAVVTTPEKSTDATLRIDYQGCADIGVCFPPQTTLLPVNLASVIPTVLAANTTVPQSDTNQTNPDTSQNNIANSDRAVSSSSNQSSGLISEQDRLAQTLSNSGIGWVILTFFGLGLLLAFTPCVFPMIPILSSIIAGQGATTSARKSFVLSLVYVLAMAVTYTVAGIFIGLSGENVQIWFQNPYVLSGLALIFVLLSLSMFGFYELQMPVSIQNRLNQLSNRQAGGSFYGVAIMGFLSALVVGPCVTAPLVGALIFIADTGNAVIGGTALFALSLGMGAPLLLIGTSFGTWLPRTGKWMEVTKAFFGVMLLALAIWMLSRFVPAQLTLFLSALLTIVTAVFMGALDSTSESTAGWRKLSKGIGIVLMLYGAALVMGAFSGSSSLLKPLSGLASSTSGAPIDASKNSDELHFEIIKTTLDLDTVIAEATANNQSVMLDFYADWCISCKEMEAFTFTDRQVQDKLRNTVTVQADVTANDADDKAMLKRFGLFGPPGIIFYRPDGREIREARVVGFMSADKFVNHLDTHLVSQ